ncbi:MAG: hypothetical protein PUC88_06910 [Clostridia bacterium]|nr:hypothetical protein [Clostridia bacterium]
MSIYKIADLYIDIDPKYEYTKERLKDYISDDNVAPDFSVRLTRDLILQEVSYAPGLPEPCYESTAIYRQICLKVLEKYNGFFFHCSALSVDNQAYLFTAQSGTGKSTHTRIWREVFGDKVVMINDDKPLLRLIDGKFYVYGTPWDGKHAISNNIKVPLKAICFLHRGEENKISKVVGIDHLHNILNQTIMPKSSTSMINLLDILEKMLTDIPTYELYCNISQEAARVSYMGMIE